MPMRSNLSPKPHFSICSICNEPVELQTAKVDASGEPVHEECDAHKTASKRSPRSVSAPADGTATPPSRAIIRFLDSINARPPTPGSCGTDAVSVAFNFDHSS
jgi:hypothetical protein